MHLWIPTGSRDVAGRGGSQKARVGPPTYAIFSQKASAPDRFVKNAEFAHLTMSGLMNILALFLLLWTLASYLQVAFFTRPCVHPMKMSYFLLFLKNKARTSHDSHLAYLRTIKDHVQNVAKKDRAPDGADKATQVL